MALLVCVAAAAGCSPGVQKLYPGPALPDSEVVTLRSRSGSPRCFVQFVDGTPVQMNPFNHRFGQYPDVLVQPGRRRLSIALYEDSPFVSWHSVRNCVIALDAKPGHEYEIVGRWVGDDRWEAWAQELPRGEGIPCLFVQ